MQVSELLTVNASAPCLCGFTEVIAGCWLTFMAINKSNRCHKLKCIAHRSTDESDFHFWRWCLFKSRFTTSNWAHLHISAAARAIKPNRCRIYANNKWPWNIVPRCKNQLHNPFRDSFYSQLHTQLMSFWRDYESQLARETKNYSSAEALMSL